uniref:Uncharacterized protein n=1 Tax=Vitis vinifera TaxID=29760 RepID=F6I6R6_VITVI
MDTSSEILSLRRSSSWHSDPSSSLLSFGVQSHHHRILGFSVHESSLSLHNFWRSEPSSSHFQLDVQSRIFSFGVQSHHHHIFSSTFRVAFSVLRSESSSSYFGFGVQSHHHHIFN